MAGRKIEQRVEEQLRRAAARATHEIARRRGDKLGMVFGCGYPKSGTVWLCQMLGSYLGSPYPQNYLLPVAMRSVIHSHADYDPRLPPTVYVTRDGRDVMTSLYFYNMRALTLPRNPKHKSKLRSKYKHAFGAGFDPQDIRRNLPRFIELEAANPTGAHVTWQEHVRDWHRTTSTVAHVSYEEMLATPTESLMRVMGEVTGEEPDEQRAQLAAERYSFATATQRKPGQEDRSSFIRKGTAGDWRNHFTREAGEVFDRHAGEALVECGYAENRRWYEGLEAS